METSIEKNPGEILLTIFPEFPLVYFCGSGSISYSHILEHIIKLDSHPNWPTKFNVYIDFDDAIVELDSNGFEQYQEFFRKIQKISNPSKWAIFTRQEMTHKSANMSHLIQGETIKVEVFISEKESLNFLKIDAETFIAARNSFLKSAISP